MNYQIQWDRLKQYVYREKVRSDRIAMSPAVSNECSAEFEHKAKAYSNVNREMSRLEKEA